MMIVCLLLPLVHPERRERNVHIHVPIRERSYQPVLLNNIHTVLVQEIIRRWPIARPAMRVIRVRDVRIHAITVKRIHLLYQELDFVRVTILQLIHLPIVRNVFHFITIRLSIAQVV